MADLEENLQAILDTLEKCQASLVQHGDRDTAQLVSVAILELRIKLNRIDDSELKALCDAILKDDAETGAAKPQEGTRPHPRVLLKLVK